VYQKHSLLANGGGIYADRFDSEEKENFDIENLTLKNKAISKIAHTNSISGQKFTAQNAAIHDLKRDSMVYKQNSLGAATGKSMGTGGGFRKEFLDKNDLARGGGIQRRTLNYR